MAVRSWMRSQRLHSIAYRNFDLKCVIRPDPAGWPVQDQTSMVYHGPEQRYSKHGSSGSQ